MHTITIQLKPDPGDILHAHVTSEPSKSQSKKAKARKADKEAKPSEPLDQKFTVAEGGPTSFDFRLEDDQKLIIELDAKGSVHYDAAQGTVTHILDDEEHEKQVEADKVTEEKKAREAASKEATKTGVPGAYSSPQAGAQTRQTRHTS